ncbi:MAG: hypothetical protein ABSG68_18695, partial [Thermoguttaceae bacterium]
HYRLGATTNLRSVPGLPSSAGNTVGQANRGTRKLKLDRPLVHSILSWSPVPRSFTSRCFLDPVLDSPSAHQIVQDLDALCIDKGVVGYRFTRIIHQVQQAEKRLADTGASRSERVAG